jgi:hypothetical protein
MLGFYSVPAVILLILQVIYDKDYDQKFGVGAISCRITSAFILGWLSVLTVALFAGEDGLVGLFYLACAVLGGMDKVSFGSLMAIAGKFKGKASLCVFAGQSVTSFFVLFLALGTGFDAYSEAGGLGYNSYFYSSCGVIAIAAAVAFSFTLNGNAVKYYFSTEESSRHLLLEESPMTQVRGLEVRQRECVCASISMFVCMCECVCV